SDFSAVRVIPSEARAQDPMAGHMRCFELTGRWAGEKDISGYQAFREEFDDWLTAIRRRSEPQLSGQSVVPVVQLVDACYRERTALAEPWLEAGLNIGGASSRSPAATGPFVSIGRKPRVLVTGAGGFLGCRLVEVLLESGEWDVR